MGFMAPHDIIALRTVSKSLANTTRERSMWIDALRCACTAHDVYCPSFPLTGMSIHELEHAATACRRFISRLRTNFFQGRIVSPVSIRYLEPAVSGEEFEHLRMIPGGRYLLTVYRNTVRLWDLGIGSNAPSMNPIASHTIEDATQIHGVLTRASKSSSGVLVFVPTTGSDGLFRFHIFSVSPPASTPHFSPFVPVLCLSMENGLPVILGVNASHIALSTSFGTVLWDYVHDSWIRWMRPGTRSDDRLYLCNNNVAIMHANQAELSVASLPILHPRCDTAAVPEVLESLQILDTYKLERYDNLQPLVSCVGSSITRAFHGRETSTIEQPLHVDIHSDNAERTLISHFALLPAAGDDIAHCELVSFGESPLDVSYLRSWAQLLEWVSPSTALSFDIEGNTVHVSLIDVDAAPSDCISGILAMPGLLDDETEVDFCSFSARGCARISSDTGFKLVVMDYLLPKMR
ncbi:F-box domain-containing protein [Mycena venus]|uniref:F-box domain-containing protein n=1 Tax=Mycena venus TaxID=2733690 RepID=A0A8H7CVW2_9AGAR|nr:F-box domain-containing protein [Mycena venus]